MCTRDVPHFLRHLRQVLVLAKDNGDVQCAVVRHAHHVQAEPQVDLLLAFDRDFMQRSVWQAHPLDAVA